MKYLAVLALLLSGCGYLAKGAVELHTVPWKACVDAGGVPIQSWVNPLMISDCVFPPSRNDGQSSGEGP